MPAKKTKNSPFAINFRRLQRYNPEIFSLEEIVFFEYLMILSQAFGYKQFYHSASMICRDIGLKRTRLERVIGKFVDMGLLSMEIKGFPKIMHFTMHIGTIMELLPNIYKSAETDTSFAEICKLFADINTQFAVNNQQENTNKRNTNKETYKEMALSKNSNLNPDIEADAEILRKSKFLINSLEEIYNKRRAAHNYKNDLYAPDDVTSFPDDVSLGYKTQKIYLLAAQAESTIATKQIENAWLVFADKIMDGELKPNKLLPYFFSKKKGEFDVIHALADTYNTYYEKTDNQHDHDGW